MAGPISVSAPNTSLIGAATKDITFNTKYPFAKLDSTNTVSFQNINLIFFTDPPNPDGVTVTELTTTVYQFKHNYNYVPATWFQAFRSVGNGDQSDSTVTKYPPYLNENSPIAISNGGAFAPEATINTKVDATNVYITVTKTNTSNPSMFGDPVNLIGYVLLIRVYVFVNDLTGTDVPTSA